MANKKINQLDTRTGAALTDLILIGDPTSGTSFKLTATDFKTLLNNVPYTGATTNVNLGEFGLLTGQLTFDQTPTGTAGVGVMRWNDSDGTIDLGLKGGNVTLQVGQELVQRVVNKSGINLLEANYQVVRVSDAQGQRLAVQLAQGNNDANSTDTIGIVTETINDNQEGFVTTSGLVRNINTTGSLQGETWIDGDVLYLSPTVAGRITKVKPTAPNHSVILGYVVYAHAVNGKIFVKVDNGYEIGELHDVYVPTPSNNDGIFWNTANSRYQNNSIAGVLGYTPISGSGATGQVAYWNGTSSQTGSNNLFWDAANARLGIGTNAPSTTLDIRGKTRIQSSGNAELDIIDGSNSLRLAMGSTQGFVGTLSSHPFGFFTGASKRGEFSTNGNFILQNGGTFSDGGQRLQVQGDAFIKGSGATSATSALLVQNSAGTELLKVDNSGQVFVPNRILTARVQTSSSGSLLEVVGGIGSATGGTGTILGQFTNVTNTSGTYDRILSSGAFMPTSGTGTFRMLNLEGVINQTGGANGITRGLYVNPTLTAAADWRSIEWSNNSGWGLYGAGTANNFLAGSLGIGTTILTGVNLYVVKAISGSTISTGIYQSGTVQSGVTSFAFGFNNTAILAASTTLGNYYHYSTDQSSFGAGATLTNQVGFFASGAMTSATNNFGFRGQIANATGRWNLYMDGTADNYLAGKLLINTTTVGTFNLDINGTARVGGSSASAQLYLKGGVGNGQYLYFDDGGSNLWTIVGASIFAIDSSSTRIFRANANAQVTINGSSVNATAQLQVDSTTRGFLPPRMTNAQRTAISSPAVGLLVYQTDATEGTYEYISSGWRIINGGGGGGSVDELQVALISQVFG
jgi:hypothetical protein